jgi:hypothetical protein
MSGIRGYDGPIQDPNTYPSDDEDHQTVEGQSAMDLLAALMLLVKDNSHDAFSPIQVHSRRSGRTWPIQRVWVGPSGQWYIDADDPDETSDVPVGVNEWGERTPS